MQDSRVTTKLSRLPLCVTRAPHKAGKSHASESRKFLRRHSLSDAKLHAWFHSISEPTMYTAHILARSQVHSEIARKLRVIKMPSPS